MAMPIYNASSGKPLMMNSIPMLEPCPCWLTMDDPYPVGITAGPLSVTRVYPTIAVCTYYNAIGEDLCVWPDGGAMNVELIWELNVSGTGSTTQPQADFMLYRGDTANCSYGLPPMSGGKQLRVLINYTSTSAEMRLLDVNTLEDSGAITLSQGNHTISATIDYDGNVSVTCEDCTLTGTGFSPTDIGGAGVTVRALNSADNTARIPSFKTWVA